MFQWTLVALEHTICHLFCPVERKIVKNYFIRECSLIVVPISLLPRNQPDANHTHTRWHSTCTPDVYDYIFIDSGSPDSYLAAGELGALTVNETLLMLGGNGTVGNGSDLGNGTATGADEPLADVITMAVTSLILGLMILITVIGGFASWSWSQLLYG